MRKSLWTLNIDNYEPEITKLTFPFLKQYARKCQAEFNVIEKRKFTKANGYYEDWPVTYEKLQIYELGKDYDWNIYIDADAIVHPDMFDITCQLDPYTVAHNANDIAGNRWIYDRFFMRDGRNIGSCNWFAVASNYCIELWKPFDDLTVAQALANIRPTINECATHVWKCQNLKQCAYEIPMTLNGQPLDPNSCPACKAAAVAVAPAPAAPCVVHQCTRCGQARVVMQKARITAEHLIDDYALSRNIAKFGLKFTTLRAIQERLGDRAFYLWHIYTLTSEDKIKQVREVMNGWGLS